MVSIIVAGFIAAVISCYHALCQGGPVVDGMSGYPYSTFLFRPDDQFMDFFNLQAVHFDPYLHLDQLRICFPFVYTISSLLFMVEAHEGFVIFNILFFVPLIFLSWHYLKGGSKFNTCRDVIIFTCLTYPVLICFDRGNLENWQFILLVALLYLFTAKRYYAAAVVLGVAIAFKPFPIVFLILFLTEKKFLPAVVSVVVAVGLTFGSLLLFAGGFSYNLHTWLGELAKYQQQYAGGIEGIFFGHSLCGMLKYIYLHHAGVAPGLHTHARMLLISKLYFPFAAVVGLAAFAYLAKFRSSLLVWEKWAILLFCMTALPFVSGDYTLIHYFIPIYLFLNAPAMARGRDMVLAVLFALLLIPKSYFYHWPVAPELTIAVVINPLLQLAIVGVIVCRKRPDASRAPGFQEGLPSPVGA